MFDPESEHNNKEKWTLEKVRNLTTGSSQKVGWKCPTHAGHAWVATVQHCLKNNSTQCTACSGW